jgi:DNA invertase Pin-like site-specific DNA recombinase
MMLSLTGFASEMERERAKQRTYDAMLRKAKPGTSLAARCTATTITKSFQPKGVGYMCSVS